MLRAVLNKNGSSLIEVVVAIALLSAGILALAAAQPQAIRNASRTDAVGRAAGILQNELEWAEAQILNRNNPIPANLFNEAVRTSHGSTVGPLANGDFEYLVTRTSVLVAGETNLWQVTVTISAPAGVEIAGLPIVGSILVSRQEMFTAS